MRKSVVALDLASRTGWAYWKRGFSEPAYGSHLISAARGGDNGPFFKAYADWFVFGLRGVADFVVYELPFTNARTHQHTAERLFGLAAMTEMLCEEARIDCRKANVQDVRRHFLGPQKLKRKEAKAAVIDQCQLHGWDPQDDDQADALALLDYSLPRIVEPSAIGWRTGHITPLLKAMGT